MKKNLKEMAEKSLKSFLKKKKVGYTAALLIGYLITGGISLSTSEDLVLQATQTQESLVANIQAQKSEILVLLEENEKRLKELKNDSYELVRKGNFYSKPIYPSDMVLFPIVWEHSGKMKNKTKSEFKVTYDTATRYYKEQGLDLNASREEAGKIPLSGLTSEEAYGLTYQEQMDLLLRKYNGTMPKENTPDKVTVDLGANIQLIEPKIPQLQVSPDVMTPNVVLPTIVTPTIVQVTPPSAPSAPGVTPITVSAPASIDKIDVAEPQVVDPNPPQERELTVAPPPSPAIFDPLMIIPPDTPTIPVVNIPTLPVININVVSDGNGYDVYVDNPSGNNSVISHVGVLGGDFKIFRNENGTTGSHNYYDNYWEYSYDNYDVVNIGNMAASGDITLAAPVGETYSTLYGLTTSGTTKISDQGQRGFMRQLEQAPTYTNGNFIITRALEDPLSETDEFIHRDIHGGTSKKIVEDRLRVASALAGKENETIDAWKDIVDNLSNYDTGESYSVLSNSGKITLEGGNLSLNNHYDHTGYGKNITINTGEITIQPYDDGINRYGGINGGFVVSRDASGRMHNILYNGPTGKMNIYTKSSVAYIIDAGYGGGGGWTNGNITLYDYSNVTWSSWQTNPTGGTPQAYDINGNNTYYQSKGDLISGYTLWSNPYGTGGQNQVHSPVNRGEINIYGAGSAGIYLKNLGDDNNYQQFSKDDRGSMTMTIDMVGVDCSANGGVADWMTYPLYGFPIVDSPYQYQHTFTPAGWPTDYKETTFGGGTADIQLVKEDGTPAPMVMYGDESVGLYVSSGSTTTATITVDEYDVGTGIGNTIDTYTTTLSTKGLITGNVHIDLGDNSSSGNKTYTSTSGETQGAQITNDPLGNTNLATIDGAAAILSGANLDLISHGIRIFEGNKGSLGVGVIDGSIHRLGTGSINILGGIDNVGVFIDDGKVISKGEINLHGGTGSVGVIQSSGNKGEADVAVINVGKADKSTEGAVGIYGINSGTELTSKGKINVYGDNFGAYATNSGKVILNRASLTGTKADPDMYVSGTTNAAGKPAGVGLMASRGTSGGIIEARNYYLKTEDNSAGVASLGTGSLVDLQGSVVDYAGKGYAVYSDGVGKIDLTNNGEIKLRSGSALELNFLISPSPVLFDSTSKITMLSNDAVAVNLTNLPGGGLFTSTLYANITGYLGGVNIVDGTEDGVTYDKYKVAAVDGGNLTIDSPLNKADSNPTSDSYFYYRRFLGQRMNVLVQQNVTATISSQLATDYFRGTVAGLEMSSSPLATGRSNTSIIINSGVTVIADRTDAGVGGIGAYINYGDLSNSGDVKVETGANIVNNGGIGLYGVNGSVVNNIGKVEVSGNEAVGMYGISYRIDSGGVIVPMEFGTTLTDQGNTILTNNGTIQMNGDKTIGMYGLNNSSDPSLPVGTPTKTVTVTNAGTIDMSAGKETIGLYGMGTITISNTGTINIGESGMGIYGSEGATITNIGTVSLGKDAIGIVLEGNANLTAPTYTPTGSWTTGEKGKIGIVMKGPVAGTIDTTPKTINTNINASGLDHGLALYVKDKSNLTSTGNISVGNEGVGIYLSNGDAENTGTISLGTSTGAVGMYATKGKLTNSGTINVNSDGQIGMVAYGTTGIVENNGNINLNNNSGTGIYLKDGATFSLGGPGAINFGTGNKNFGVFADKGTVNIGVPVTVVLSNANENIYIYGKNESKINHTTGLMTVNGGGAAGNKKTVGIYLNNNTNKRNEYLSAGGTMAVTGAAVGIYSKNTNDLVLTQVDVTGDKTVGIYMENGGKVEGKITSSGATITQSVVGLYGNGGTIEISNPSILEMGTGNTYGLGMYSENGAKLDGAAITVENKNALDTNVGIYYTGNNTISHNTDITLLGNKIVALYADNGVNLTSGKAINFTTGNTEQVGSYVLGNAQYTNNSTMSVASNSSTAIYVGEGTGTNAGTIKTTGTNSAALVAQGKLVTSIGKVVNTGKIETNSGVGILLGDVSAPGILGKSQGENSGLIEVGIGGTGVALSGNDRSEFRGTGGTMEVTGASGTESTGLMLLGTSSGQVTDAGTIDLKNTYGIAVYGKDSDIDFNLELKGENGGTGVFADDTTGGAVSGTIDASQSKGMVALYVKNTLTNLTGVVVRAGRSIAAGATGVGIYLGDNYTLSNATVDTTGDSVGIVVASGKTLDYSSGSVLNVTADGTGIYVGGAGSVLDTTDGVININGAGTGISVGLGATANIGVAGPLTINFTGTGGVAVVSEAGGIVNLGSNLVLTGVGTVAATQDGNLTNNGLLEVSGGSVGLLGTFTTGGSLANSSTGVIKVKSGSIGMSASGTGVVGLTNDGLIEVENLGSIGIATDVGVVNTGTTGTMKVKDDAIGIYVKGTALINNLGIIDVEGGVAFVSDGTASTPTGTINLKDGSVGKYSIGGYYIDATSIPNTYTTNQTGNYSIGTVVKGNNSTTVNQLNTIGGAGKVEQIALMAEGQNGNTLNLSLNAPIVIQDGGRNNLGVYGNSANILMGGSTISVGDSEASADMSKSSIGAYVKTGSLSTTGAVNVGQNSFGIVGKNISNISTGTLTISDKGIGIYGEGDGTGGRITTGAMTTGNNNSIGIYGKGIGAKVSGGMAVGNTNSLGIINEGTGNIELDGTISVAGVNNIDTKEGSIAIYKNGPSGNIMVGHGSTTVMNIGREGYALYVKGGVKDSGNTVVVDNNGDINLSTSAVGIYGSGDVLVKHTGKIVTGDTYLGPEGDHAKTEQHRNSVGIYAADGAVVQSSGVIEVKHDHSVGIYGKGQGTVVSLTGGTLSVDNGGVGILVKDGAIATVESGALVVVNETTSPSCGGNSIGIAAYAGSSIENKGTITINDGVGIYVTAGATFTNNGVLNLNNGIGIGGNGAYIVGPNGSVNISGGSLVASTESSDTTKGSVTISKDGTIIINGNYITLGGTLDASDTSIKLNGAYVAIEALTDAKVPLFTADIVEGNIKLLPDFAQAGNGYEWTITNFNKALGAAVTESGTSSKVTIETSPLFVKKEITMPNGDQAMRIAKVPYKDLVVEDQFENMYDGLENLLYNGKKGSDRLKDFNAYLERQYAEQGTGGFNSELSRGMSELRGDIYSTTQRRMQDIQRAVDSSWDELEKQYNISKDSSKYSVIHKYGEFRDDTIGVDDYDYTTYGLLYMKEYEGRNYLDKHGFTLGFAVSKFEFDDNGKYDNKSKEDVYSVRVGVHNVKSLLNSDEADRTRLVTKLELGYNRHEAKRVIELDKVTTAKGNYNSYMISLDNKVEHVLSRSYNHKVGIYGALNVEYGRLSGFSEKSGEGLEVKLKSNDYLSIQPEVGMDFELRHHIGKGLSAKLTGKIAYAHELGENYKRNKAKIKDGETGYYDLIRPDKEKGIIKGKVGIAIEKADKIGVSFDVEARKHSNKKDTDMTYGVNFKYVF